MEIRELLDKELKKTIVLKNLSDELQENRETI